MKLGNRNSLQNLRIFVFYKGEFIEYISIAEYI